MTEHPENTPVNRFFAFLWALGGVLVFGFLGLLIAGVGSAGDDGTEAYDAKRAAGRSAKLAQVREAQSMLLAGKGEAVEGAAGKIRVPVEVAAEMVLKEIRKSVPRVTAIPVPGTPAALELMQQQAAEQPPAAAEAPNAPAKEAKAGGEKPAAGAAAPEAPAKDGKATDETPAAPKKAGGDKGKGKGKSGPKVPVIK